MKVLIAAVLYCLFFVSVEVITRKTKVSKEISRKTIHVIAGISAALLPLVLSFHEILYLSSLFLLLMLLSKKINLFSSIHEVKRQTYGEVYFPLAVFIMAAVFPHQVFYMYGLLIMAVSDGSASIIGQKYGRKKYKLGLSEKSYIGSLTFLVSTVAIGIISFIAIGAGIAQAIYFSFLIAIILTLTEGLLSYGLDNLVVSPAAGLLMWCVIRIVGLN
jgi:phytol kinase